MERPGRNHGPRIVLQHKVTGETFTGTKYEAVKFIGDQDGVYGVFSGRLKSTNGWRAIGFDGEKQKQIRKYQPKVLPDLCCKFCEKTFSPTNKRQVFCGRECLEMSKSIAREAPPVQPKKCTVCGSSYIPKSKATAERSIYCGNKCKVMAWNRSNIERKRLLDSQAHERRHERLANDLQYQQRKAQIHAVGLLTRALRRVGTRKKKEQKREVYLAHALLPRLCVDCGNEFPRETHIGKPRQRCEPCTEQQQRRIQKAHKLFRKAIERGANGGEKVDPYKVFSRDRWTCQLCGTKTPRKLRGTYDDNAPELDHILPISKGGLHTYLNTQCACRKCNAAKGDRPLGQMLLLSA